MAVPVASNSLSLKVFEAAARFGISASVDSTNTSKYRCSSRAIGAVQSARAGVKARRSFQQGFGDCSADQASRGRVLAGDQAAVNY